MATALLTRGGDPRTIKLHRYGLGTRLLAHTRALSLDQSLVAGANPDSRALLSVRAHRLLSRTHRVRLARELRQLARDAARPGHPFDPVLRLSKRILFERDLIEEIAEVLEGLEAVDARGLAKLELLLRDGGGPFFFEDGMVPLRESLEGVIDALALPPAIHADA